MRRTENRASASMAERTTPSGLTQLQNLSQDKKDGGLPKWGVLWTVLALGPMREKGDEAQAMARALRPQSFNFVRQEGRWKFSEWRAED